MEDTVIVEGCMFFKCQSENRGGAISLYNTNYEFPFVIFLDSSFVECKAAIGGAFFVICPSFSLNRCCILKCSAGESGSALFYGNTQEKTSAFRTLGVFQCSSFGPESTGSISIIENNHIISNLNSSANTDIGKGTGFGCLNVRSTFVQYCSFKNDTGTAIFLFKNSSEIRMVCCEVLDNSMDATLFDSFSTSPSIPNLYLLYVSFLRNNIVNRDGQKNIIAPLKKDRYMNTTIKSCYIDSDSMNALSLNMMIQNHFAFDEIAPQTPINDISMPPDCFESVQTSSDTYKAVGSTYVIWIVGICSGSIIFVGVLSFFFYRRARIKEYQQWVLARQEPAAEIH